MDGANAQTRGTNRSSTFVLTAFISFGLFNIFPCTDPPRQHPLEAPYGSVVN
jgi:hypothetical protein